MRRVPAGRAAVGLLWVLAGCARPARDPALSAGGLAATTTTARPRAAPVKQRGPHLNGRQLNLAVYYLRTFQGRRYLAPEWHPVPSTRAVAAAAVGELLEGEPYAPGARRPFPPRARARAGRPPRGAPPPPPPAPARGGARIGPGPPPVARPGPPPPATTGRPGR